jgi:hypothetical protein
VKLAFVHEGDRLGITLGYAGRYAESVRLDDLTVELPSTAGLDIAEEEVDLVVRDVFGPMHLRAGGNADVEGLAAIDVSTGGNLRAHTKGNLKAVSDGNADVAAGSGVLTGGGNAVVQWTGQGPLVVHADGNLVVRVPADLDFTLDATADGNLAVEVGATSLNGKGGSHQFAIIGRGGPLLVLVGGGNVQVTSDDR